jgi:hypothetical protein
LLLPSVLLRRLKATPSTSDLVTGYSRSNTPPLLKRVLARSDELIEAVKRRRTLGEKLLIRDKAARLGHLAATGASSSR